MQNSKAISHVLSNNRQLLAMLSRQTATACWTCNVGLEERMNADDRHSAERSCTYDIECLQQTPAGQNPGWPGRWTLFIGQSNNISPSSDTVLSGFAAAQHIGRVFFKRFQTTLPACHVLEMLSASWGRAAGSWQGYRLMLVATGSIDRSRSIGSVLIQTPPYCTLIPHPPGKPIVRANALLATPITGSAWRGMPNSLAELVVCDVPTKGRCTFADNCPWLL